MPPQEGSREPYGGKGTLETEHGRCFDSLLLTTPPLLPRCSPPLSSTKRAMVSTPSPARRLLNTNGRVPRMRLASRSMTVSEAPTWGARSILLRQVGARDARAAFGRNLVAGGDVDDIKRQVRKLRRKCRRQVVAAGFDQNEIERRKFLLHLCDRGEIDRGVLADRGVRTAAGLDAGDAFRRKCPGPYEVFGVPLGVDVVGDRRNLVAGAQPLAQGVHQPGLARADRAADTDA